jgi:hypothetical protein
MGLLSKKKKNKNLEKQFGKKQANEIIKEWDEAAERIWDEKVEKALIKMRERVVKRISELKQEDITEDLKRHKIEKYIISQLKEDEIINTRLKDEVKESEKFYLTKKSWREGIKKIWSFADKVSGAKAVLLYCHSWDTRHCEMIPLESNQSIFLYEENRELFYLDKPFIVIDDKPVYFVLRGLVFSYEFELNIKGLAESIDNIKKIDPKFVARRKHLGSRAMYTIWQDACLDRMSGYKPTRWDKFKNFIIPFTMGVMSTLIFCMPVMFSSESSEKSAFLGGSLFNLIRFLGV